MTPAIERPLKFSNKPEYAICPSCVALGGLQEGHCILAMILCYNLCPF
jgi:hypothetical protein